MPIVLFTVALERTGQPSPWLRWPFVGEFTYREGAVRFAEELDRRGIAHGPIESHEMTIEEQIRGIGGN